MKNLLNKVPSRTGILLILFILGLLMFLFRIMFEGISEKDIVVAEGKCKVIEYKSLPNYNHKMVIDVNGFKYNTPNTNTILNMKQYKNNYCIVYKNGGIDYKILSEKEADK